MYSHSCNLKVLDFVPFCGSYVREFELSHSNLVKRIINITHAHDLHVTMLDFATFTICTWKKDMTLLKSPPFLTSASNLQ